MSWESDAHDQEAYEYWMSMRQHEIDAHIEELYQQLIIDQHKLEAIKNVKIL